MPIPTVSSSRTINPTYSSLPTLKPVVVRKPHGCTITDRIIRFLHTTQRFTDKYGFRQRTVYFVLDQRSLVLEKLLRRDCNEEDLLTHELHKTCGKRCGQAKIITYEQLWQMFDDRFEQHHPCGTVSFVLFDVDKMISKLDMARTNVYLYHRENTFLTALYQLYCNDTFTNCLLEMMNVYGQGRGQDYYMVQEDKNLFWTKALTRLVDEAKIVKELGFFYKAHNHLYADDSAFYHAIEECKKKSPRIYRRMGKILKYYTALNWLVYHDLCVYKLRDSNMCVKPKLLSEALKYNDTLPDEIKFLFNDYIADMVEELLRYVRVTEKQWKAEEEEEEEEKKEKKTTSTIR